MTAKTARASKHGFTLIEFVASVGIIAILSAVLFPIFAKARQKSAETVCISNEKQLSTAINMYVQDNDQWLPINHYDRGIAWHELIAPYVKQRSAFKCPADTIDKVKSESVTSYGVNGFFDDGANVNKIVGDTCIIYLTETAAWNRSAHFHPMCWNNDPINAWAFVNGHPTETAWNKHSGGANYLFVDGHTQWENIESVFDPQENVDLFDPTP